jgi:hypothetical protein
MPLYYPDVAMQLPGTDSAAPGTKEMGNPHAGWK